MFEKPKFTGNMPPTIVDLPSGRWAVSGSCWIAVGPTVTLDEVRSWWEKPVVKKSKDPISSFPKGSVEYIVIGSRGNTYKVICQDAHWTCTCPAFEFSGRKNTCKHIEKIKNGLT